MTAYTVDVTCPRCGDPVDHVTNSTTGPVVTLAARTIVSCPRCRTGWLLVLELAPVDRNAPTHDPRTRAECGTNAAYAGHISRGETTCQPCRDAHRIYVADSDRAAGRRSHKRKKVDA
jgi:endogenous inhibitor of DNA gyrase (YacG/DUF329 family)